MLQGKIIDADARRRDLESSRNPLLNTIKQLKDNNIELAQTAKQRLESANRELQAEEDEFRDEIESSFAEKFEKIKRNHIKEVEGLKNALSLNGDNSALQDKIKLITRDILTLRSELNSERQKSLLFDKIIRQCELTSILCTIRSHKTHQV